MRPPHLIYRVDGGARRWYFAVNDDGKLVAFGEHDWLVSVTTLLSATMPTSPFLIQWMKDTPNPDEVRDERAAYGTWLHVQIDRLLKEGNYFFSDMDVSIEGALYDADLPHKYAATWRKDGQQDLLAFESFRREFKIKPLAIEVCLGSDNGWGGAIDLVCEMTVGTGKNCRVLQRDKGGERILGIIDYKSGRKGFWESHEIQLHLYLDMWNENFPDMPINRSFNWSPLGWRTKPNFAFEEQTNKPSRSKIPLLKQMFEIDNPDRGPKPRLVVGSCIDSKVDMEELYSFVDPREVILNKHNELPEIPEVSAEK